MRTGQLLQRAISMLSLATWSTCALCWKKSRKERRKKRVHERNSRCKQQTSALCSWHIFQWQRVFVACEEHVLKRLMKAALTGLYYLPYRCSVAVLGLERDDIECHKDTNKQKKSGQKRLLHLLARLLWRQGPAILVVRTRCWWLL